MISIRCIFLRAFLRSNNIIFLGIIIRLVLMPFFAHPFDMYVKYSYVDEIFRQGVTTIGFNPIFDIYQISITPIYYWLSNTFSISATAISTLPESFNPGYGVTVVTDPIFNTLVKVPLIVSDILSAFLIYKIAFFFTRDNTTSRNASFLYFFNPIVIWISAAWGQYDSLAVLFTLLSFYLLLTKKKYFFSAQSLYIAFFVKIYPIFFLVPICISIIRFAKHKLLNIFKYLIFLIPLSIYLLLLFRDVTLNLLNSLFVPSGFFLISGFGLTYWSISLIYPINLFWSGLLSNLVLISLVSLASYFVIKIAKDKFDVIIIGSFMYISAFFLSLTIITEQRSLMLFALLSLITINKGSLRPYYIFLSITAFLYAQKNFPFYILPLASQFPSSFEFLFNNISIYVDRSTEILIPTMLSGFVLFILGTSFSIGLIIIIWKLFRLNNNT